MAMERLNTHLPLASTFRPLIAWLQSVADDQLFVSALTLGELQAGAERTRRQDQEKADAIEAWIDQLSET